MLTGGVNRREGCRATEDEKSSRNGGREMVKISAPNWWVGYWL